MKRRGEEDKSGRKGGRKEASREENSFGTGRETAQSTDVALETK